MSSGGSCLRERELWGCGEAPQRHLSSRGWGDLRGLRSSCCMYKYCGATHDEDPTTDLMPVGPLLPSDA
ncbi:hypothetical protein NDU88_003867 [Pleurodeles waltl]|uniref:Uncharacterized protein n=1 Tax=Pleurodeles waltl TaxID=8319 RepID=A0AAV7W6M6_PLEWA|nr:hypothetical protein NDU88_003867 [Pleurodeles waltl]